jgi:glycosidase
MGKLNFKMYYILITTKSTFSTRFFKHQADLNYDNPKVQEELFKIIKFWHDIGIDVFRVDAVPFLFKREGTSCESLKETHEFIKKIRKFVDRYNAVILAEANQMPKDTYEYLKTGDEFHMGFHFPLMPRIYIALKKENTTNIIRCYTII